MLVERISVSDAARDLPGLIVRLTKEGISIELQQDDRVIARLSPVQERPSLSASELNRVFANLPPLGDELEPFARDSEVQQTGNLPTHHVTEP